MKRRIYLLIGALCLICTAARAEMIQGMITYLDPTNSLMSVKPTAPPKSNPAQRLIRLRDGAEKLEVGQVVVVEAMPNEAQKILEAKSIQVKALTSA